VNKSLKITTSLLGLTVFLILCFENCAERRLVLSENVTAQESNVEIPKVFISANSTTVAPNASTTLNWSTENVISCLALGDWSGARGTSGSESTPNITASKLYGLTCTGPNGSATESVVVSIAGAQPTAVPNIIFAASPSPIVYGSNTRLTWSSVNATLCTNLSTGVVGFGQGSSIGLSGSANTENLIASKEFRIRCTGAGGALEASALVTVTPPLVIRQTATCTASQSNFGTVTGSATRDIVNSVPQNFTTRVTARNAISGLTSSGSGVLSASTAVGVFSRAPSVARQDAAGVNVPDLGGCIGLWR